MSQRFHINTKDEPKPCTATIRTCKFGGDSGEDDHFETAADARKFVENKMSSEVLVSHKKEIIEITPEVDSSLKVDNSESSYEDDELIPSDIYLKSNLGGWEVSNGDLYNPDARLALSSGLCGGLALAIHNISGADVYFVRSIGDTEKAAKDKFEADPNDAFNASHVVVRSLSNPDKFIDSYGQKSKEEIEAFFAGSLVRGTKEMAERFSGSDHENLREFALAALELDKDSESFDYERVDEDYELEEDDYDDEEEFEDEEYEDD